MSMAYEIFLSELHDFEQSFLDEPIQIVEGYNFNQYDTVRRIHLYYSGNFENNQPGNVYFHNLSRDKVRNGVKNIDLDTKDLKIVAENPVKDWAKSYVAREKAKREFKKMKLGVTMNECTRLFCKSGTLVLKKVPNKKETFCPVDLRNIRNEPTVNELWDSPIFIENHYMFPQDLIEMSKDWNDKENVDRVLEYYKNSGSDSEALEKGDKMSVVKDGFINVKEVYATIPESYVKDDGADDVYKRYKFIIVMNEEQKNSKLKGLVLYEKEIKSKKEWPYKEVHLDRIEGRWLGLGLVEEIFDLQVRKNELVNLRFSALRYAAIALFQTQDQTILKNILTDLDNGDIVSVNQLMTRVPTEMRDPGVFQMEEQDLEGNAAKLTNSFEVTSGEELPSGTPYSLGALLDRNVNKYYEFVREEYGLFWKEVVMEWIMPDAMRSMDKAEIMKITDMEMLPKLIDAFSKVKIWDAIKRFIINFGRKPTKEEFETAKGFIEAQFRNEFILDVPDGYLKDFEYDLDMVVTGESMDKRQLLVTISSALQILGENPTVLQNPVSKRLFSTLLEAAGLSVADIGLSEPTLPQEVGGGVPVEATENIVESVSPQQLPAPQAPQI